MQALNFLIDFPLHGQHYKPWSWSRWQDGKMAMVNITSPAGEAFFMLVVIIANVLSNMILIHPTVLHKEMVTDYPLSVLAL